MDYEFPTETAVPTRTCPPAGVPDGTFMRQIHQIWCIIEAMAYCDVQVLFWHIFIKFTQKCKILAFFIWCQFRVKFFDSRGNLIFPTFSHVGGRGGVFCHVSDAKASPSPSSPSPPLQQLC